MIHLTGHLLPYTKMFESCKSEREFIRVLEQKLSDIGVESWCFYY
jgi:hypothetical protein